MHFPNSVVTADDRLDAVATALHEMMSRQLVHRKEGFHRLGVWPGVVTMQRQISRCKNLEFSRHDNGPHVAILPAHFHYPIAGQDFQGTGKIACFAAGNSSQTADGFGL